MKIVFWPIWITLSFLVLLTSCGGGQDLQKYFVEKAEDRAFYAIDIPVSALLANASEDKKQDDLGIESFNVLVFRNSPDRSSTYEQELNHVKGLLAHPDFNELLKFNSPDGSGQIKFLGTTDAATEVILLGYQPENGFMLVRLAGKDLDPSRLMPMLRSIQEGGVDALDLSSIAPLFKD
jgi:hypothetical protein